MKNMRYLWKSLLRASGIAVAVATSVFMPSPGRAATEVNTCGQVLSGNGFLSADLDCSGFVGNAVTLQGRELDLRGFTLTASAPSTGVFCEKTCAVTSDPPGGTITSDGSGTIAAVAATCPIFCGSTYRVDLAVSNVVINDGRLFAEQGTIKLFDSTIIGIVDPGSAGLRQFFGLARVHRSVVTGNAGNGIGCPRAHVVDSEISNNGGVGVDAPFRVQIKRSTVSGNVAEGIATPRSVKMRDSSVTGNGQSGMLMSSGCGGLAKCKIIARDSVVSDNVGAGVSAARVPKIAVRDSTINDNGAEGILQGRWLIDARLKLIDSLVTGNGLDGITQVETSTTCNKRSCKCRLQLKGSTVIGNGIDASCGVSRTCADLGSRDLPKVTSSTCNTSYDTDSGFPGTSWGVCALD